MKQRQVGDIVILAQGLPDGRRRDRRAGSGHQVSERVGNKQLLINLAETQH